MTTVYIAGPMRGYPSFNFPAFHQAEAWFRDHGWNVLNPARMDEAEGFDPRTDPAGTPESYMRRDLPLLMNCDAIALLPGWRASNGARNELAVARMCGLQILDAETMEDLPDETILEEAQRIVHSDRGAAYGPPEIDFARTGRMWGAILGIPDVPPEKVGLCMVAVKIGREVNEHRRDNLVDLAGYAETVDLIWQRRAA